MAVFHAERRSLARLERASRHLARLGTVAVAITFGGFFLTDRNHYNGVMVPYIPIVIAQIVALLTMFAGYVVAWRRPTELLGSLLSIAALVVFLVIAAFNHGASLPWMVVIASLPAVLHLLAVGVHTWRESRLGTTQRAA